jgi:SAM-dependent methyltransferase
VPPTDDALPPQDATPREPRTPDGDDAVPRPPLAGASPADAAAASAARARGAVATQYAVQSPRYAAAKRAALPLSRALTGRLVQAVEALADGLDGLVAAHRGAATVAERERDALRAEVAALQARCEELELHRVDVTTDLHRLRREIASHAPGAAGERAPAPGAPTAEAEPLDAAAYLEFERRFRGSRAEIQQRQRDAVRHVESLAGGDAPVLDLGAGRGEWLAVLAEAGVPAYGVDTNAEMAGEAVAAGLDVRTEDALVHLEELPEATLGAVTGFHLAEHLPIPALTRVLDAAYLALQPGGVVVLETPDPTNLGVGTAGFYLDPTHLRPLHPLFLQFLVEQRGFVDVEVHRVHPVDAALAAPQGGDEPRARVVDALAQALFGPQDYVVVGRRPAGTPATDAARATSAAAQD